MFPSVVSNGSKTVASSGSSTLITNATPNPQGFYKVSATSAGAVWIKQGTNATIAVVAAANTNDNAYIAAGDWIIVDGRMGPDIAVIQDGAPGRIIISPVGNY